MAELVQTFLEDMIPEMEQMDSIGLFTKKEVAIILKRRRTFEYKLRKMGKQSNDFVEYIQYEQNVLSLIRMRRKQTGCKLKKHLIEVPIVRRIHRLYGQSTKRFPRDIQLWLSHIEFAKAQNEKGSVTRVISKMLRAHNHQPELWIFAAKYEFEDNKDSDTARRFFHRGLQFNFESRILWLEYYRMEMLVCQKTRMRLEVLGGAPGDEVDKNIMDCSVALVVIDKAREAIPNDVSFLLKFLPICRLFDFTEQHEDAIFELLIENYSNDELTWDAVARRKLHESTKRRAAGSKLLPIHFKVSLETFDQAVETVPTEKMYGLYINFCLEQLKKSANHKDAKSNLVQWSLNVFDTAHAKNLLAVDMFAKWNNLLTDVGLVEKALLILEHATKKHPTDVNLWGDLLQHHYLGGLNNSKKVEKTFESALKVVKDEDSWPLWEIVWNYSTSFNIKRLIQKLCDRGLLNPQPKISSQIKTKCLIWLYVTQGIKSARTHFKKFQRTRPITRSFFDEYINMEMAECKVNLDNVRTAYSEALETYGKDDTDLWIDYMRLEMTHQEGKLDLLPLIYFKATKTLDSSALDDFTHKYTMFRNGISPDKA